MPHIAFFISTLGKGGAERVMANLIRYFGNKGYQITVVTQYSVADEYNIGDVKRIYSEISAEEESSSRIINFVRRYRKLRGIWKQEKPDVILSFIGLNNIMTLLTTRGLNIPVAVAVRGMPEEEYAGAKLRFFTQLTFKKANAVILQTEESATFWKKKINSVVLKNPVSDELLSRPPYEGIREKRIVTAGRLDDNKNHSMLIRAFAKAHETHPEYKLTIYGNGEDKDILLALIDELKLEDAVELPGSVDNIWDQMERAEIFVLTSKTEGMPNALLEAMMLGLACISTDCPCGGPKQLIRNGENGILVNVDDENALTDNLLRLMDTSELIRKLGNNAARIREEYEPAATYGQWEKVLTGIIGE